MPLSESDFDLLAAALEPLIETSAGGRTYQTIIWVVEDDGTLFVRSFLGDDGKWYQRAVANPNISLIVDDRHFAFRAVPATDSSSVARASEGFRRKYRPGRSLDAMLVDDMLHTTLRLDPVD